MAWDLLMDPGYQNLVRTICSGQDELKRFRQLLVQTVMATDIADADLRTARNQRWDKAFAKQALSMDASAIGNPEEESESDADRNRKATIVLEHLLQASDIAHTMQHWEVFKKWVRLIDIY
jgi:3'5'-cyclic nucleotide phosphodiesterase